GADPGRRRPGRAGAPGRVLRDPVAAVVPCARGRVRAAGRGEVPTGLISERPGTSTSRARGGCRVDYKLELVLIPVSDVDRAKAFYVDRAGFNLDVDTEVGDGMRIIQMTP